MKTKKQFNIEYNYSPVYQGDDMEKLENLPKNHTSLVQENLMNEIFEMARKGYTSGEIFTSVDEVEYKGFFNLNY